MPYTPWSKKELKILKDNYPTMGAQVKKLLPNRTKGAIATKARIIGVKVTEPIPLSKNRASYLFH